MEQRSSNCFLMQVIKKGIKIHILKLVKSSHVIDYNPFKNIILVNMQYSNERSHSCSSGTSKKDLSELHTHQIPSNLIEHSIAVISANQIHIQIKQQTDIA